MKAVKCKFLVMSSAALLAGTVIAAGQGAQERKEGGQQPGMSQSQPKTMPQGQQREQRSGETQQSRPSTSGQTQRNEEQNRSQDSQRTPGQSQNPRDQEQRRTQGQSQNPRDQEQGRTQGHSQTPRDQDQNRAQEQNPRGRQDRTEGRQEQGARANGGTNSVNLTTEQRTNLRQTVIEGRDAPKVGRVDFSVTEGTVVPRSVRLVAVPETIVQIHPDWRGYRYFVYNDEIIIVEPDTLKIVAVVEV